MIQADKAACDVNKALVDLIKDVERVITVTISVEL